MAGTAGDPAGLAAREPGRAGRVGPGAGKGRAGSPAGAARFLLLSFGGYSADRKAQGGGESLPVRGLRPREEGGPSEPDCG